MRAVISFLRGLDCGYITTLWFRARSTYLAHKQRRVDACTRPPGDGARLDLFEQACEPGPLKTGPGKWVFEKCNDIIIGILKCADSGAQFVFGNLIKQFVPVGTVESSGNFVQTQQLVVDNGMAFFAFSVLPTIIFFSALITVLYHFK